MEVFTVIAHRWGDDHNHSYFVGTYSTKELAYEMARAEEHWRAGKYECKVISFILDDIDAEVIDFYRSNLDYAEEGITTIKDVLHQLEPECKTHPDAPHGFNRGASHAEGRYVCDCENWEPEVWPDEVNSDVIDAYLEDTEEEKW